MVRVFFRKLDRNGLGMQAFFGLLILVSFSFSAAFSADGPSSQKEAEAWLEQVLEQVEKTAGLKFPKDRRPRIRLSTPEEAGRVLGTEFGARLPAAIREKLPPPEHFGVQFLARYSFDTRTVFFVPSNLTHVHVARNMSALDRMHLLKIVLTYACDMALMDSHIPLAGSYYAPGGTDAALAARCVWEGHARLAQEAMAKATGCSPTAKSAALMNSFSILPAIKAEFKKNQQRVLLKRITTMGRIASISEKFATELQKAKGPKWVIEAIRKPPIRTSQVLVPADYLNNKGYSPTDEVLGETLARAAGVFFPPDIWDNRSSALGALSLEDIVKQADWERGAGPLQRLGESFDKEYVGGRSLLGRHRFMTAARASAIHVFRTTGGADRFIKWKVKQLREDWRRLEKERFAIRKPKDRDVKKMDLSKDAAEKVDGGHELRATVVRANGTDFSDAHYYFRKGTWVLELDLDFHPPVSMLNDAILELAKSVEKELALEKKGK